MFPTSTNSILELCLHIEIQFCFIVVIVEHVKLLMDVLHILYADVENELIMYTTTGLIRKVVLGTLVPY
jgi:hypothetical protein